MPLEPGKFSRPSGSSKLDIWELDFKREFVNALDKQEVHHRQLGKTFRGSIISTVVHHITGMPQEKARIIRIQVPGYQ